MQDASHPATGLPGFRDGVRVVLLQAAWKGGVPYFGATLSRVGYFGV